MTVLITLTTAGTDSGPFNLYTELDGYVTPFETGVDKIDLEAGYTTALVPDYATIVRVKSTGDCVNYIDITLTSPTTTTTSTSSTTTTTTTTVAPTTTTTTTLGYVLWPLSTLTDPSDTIACGLALDTFVYSAPGSLAMTTNFYYDTALTNPFVGNSEFYHITEGATNYAISLNGSGVGSALTAC